jgi:hypothetical protein
MAVTARQAVAAGRRHDAGLRLWSDKWTSRAKQTTIDAMAVAFLRLTESGGQPGPETAASESLKRSVPLLLVSDTLDPRLGIQTTVLIVKPPSDGPQVPIWLAEEWDLSVTFSVSAYVIAGNRDAVPAESIIDKYIADIREQIGSAAAPLFFYDPSIDAVPEDLLRILTELAHEMTPLETFNLPLFVEAAGGEQQVERLIARALIARGGESDSVLENFALETRGVLEGVTENWSFDPAVSWLRSRNAFLNGARPIDVLVLESSRPVVDAAYGGTWGLFG